MVCGSAKRASSLVVLGLFSRMVVGWAQGERLKAELVRDAMQIAFLRLKTK